VNSIPKARIAAKEQRLSAEASGLFNGVLEQAATDSSAAQMRRNRHSRKLVHTVFHRDQCNAPDGFDSGVCHEDVTAFQENRINGVIESFPVFGFKSEILRDPLFVPAH
jgi:hypothetical protein